jgi:autotransporter-associated beta strand protein
MCTLAQSLVPSASLRFWRPAAIALLAIVSVAAFSCGRAAYGVNYIWNAAGPTDWNNGANWTPAGGPPGTLPADNALIDNGGTAVIDPTGFGSGPILPFDNLKFDGTATGGTINQLSGTVSLVGTEAPAVPNGPGELLMGTNAAAVAGATNTYNIQGGTFRTSGIAAGGGYVYIGETGNNTAPLSKFVQGTVGDAGTTSVIIGSTVNGIAGSRLEIGGGQSATGGNGLYVLNSGTLTLNGNGVGMEIGRVGTGNGTARGELDVNGGTLNAGTSGAQQTSDVYLGRSAAAQNSAGFIEQTGGAVNIGARSNNNLILGFSGNGTGQYDLSGGTLTVGNFNATPPTNDSNGGALILGNGTPSTAGKVTGIMNISGTGNLVAPGFATLVGNATGATGTITQTGGSASFGQSGNNGALILGAAAGGIGNYTLSGGSFSANGASLGNANGAIGTFTQSGGTTATFGQSNFAALRVGGNGTGSGTYTLSGAGSTLNTAGAATNQGLLIIADGAPGGSGTFTMGAGTTLNTAGEMWLGHGGMGVFNQNGGTANIGLGTGGWTVVGNQGGSTGTYNMHGGVLNTTRVGISNNGATAGFFVQDNTASGGAGTVVNSNDDIVVGSGTPGTYTISGPSSGPDAVVVNSALTGTISFNDVGQGMLIGNYIGGAQSVVNQNGGLVNTVSQNGVAIRMGTYNLGNGPGSTAILSTQEVYKLSATSLSIFNFNGGLLQANSAPSAAFPIFMGPGNPATTGGTLIRALDQANVQAGGAIIDPQAFNIIISQNLSHDPALGAALDGGLTLQTNSVNAPGTLTLSGANTFSGDTHVTATGPMGANDLLILGSTLALGGSTLNMTINSGPGAPSPMVQFAPGVSSFTLGGLKGGANLALPDSGGAGITLSVGNNNQNTTYTGVLSDTGGAAASGLTKIGTGTLHLTAVQTYTGPTFVSNGTLSLNGASIAASSGVQVGGPLSTGPFPTLLAQNGANAGSVTVGPIYGTFGPGDVNIANANSLTINDRGAISLTLGSSSSPNSDLIAVSGALTLPTVGVAKVNLADNANAGGLGSMGPGTYKIITYGSLTNAFDPLSLSPGVTALPGDTYLFSQTGSEIDVQVVAAKSWTGAVDDNWGTTTAPTNWAGGIIPGATSGTTNSDTADFNAVSGNTNVAVDSGRNVRSITFEAAAAGYTIGTAGGNQLLLSTGGAIQNTSAVANDENVNAPLVLEGANGTYTFSANSATNVLNVGGAITGGAPGNTILTLNGSSTGANTISGAIGNGTATTVALFKAGAGTWVLSGNNTFTGGVTIDGGTLRVGSTNAFNSAIPVKFTNITTGTLSLNGFNTTIGGLNGATATGTVNNGSAASTATLTVNSGATPNSFSGLLADGGTKALNLTLSSAAGGDLTLTNANTFSGVTNVTGAGTIILSNANALQNSTLNVTVAGNSVQFTAGLTPFTLGGLSGPAGLVLQDTAAGPITVNIGNNNQNTQYDGVLSEVGAGSAVNKIGTGTLSLSQAPTYTGTTTVSAGTLAFDPAAGTLTFAGVIAGPGVVAATGPGALTLTNGGNTWSGGLVVSPGVTVTAGPWQTGAGNPLGTGAVTLNAGSTLNLAGSAAAAVPPPFDPAQTYAAGLTIAGDSTVNVTGSPAATMGTLRIGAKLSLTGDPGSSLTMGATTLTGPATVNPTANTTLTLGRISETGGPQSLSMVGAGTLAVGTPGTFSGGTSISNGTTVVTNNSALGTNAIGMTGGKLQLGLLPKSAIGVNIIGNIGYNAGSVGAGSVPVGETAGVFAMQNWNNANGGGAGGAGSAPITGTQVLQFENPVGSGHFNTGIQSPTANTVVDNLGVPTAATISYHTPANGWSITQNLALNHGNTALMNGYLDTTVASTAPGFGNPTPAAATTFSVAGLPYAKTDVYVYFGDFQDGGVGGGYLRQVGAGQPGSADKPYFGISNDANDANAAFPGFIQATAYGTTATTLDGASPALAPSNYFFYPAVDTSGAGSAGAIDFVLLHDPSSPSNVGLHGIEFVDATPGGSSATLANALNITGNATIDVTGGSAGGVTGAVTIDSHTLFVTGGSSGPNLPYTLILGATTLHGNPTFDVANNGTGLGTARLASLNDGGAARVVTKANVGTLEIDGASNLTGGAPGTSILVNAGTLRFKNTVGAATIGAGVSVTVASAATLELAGSVSDLSSATTPLTRAHVINNGKQASGGSLQVTGTNQQVGGIDGIGDTIVNAGAKLTADHIVQTTLAIGGSATSLGAVTLAPSDAAGSPMASGLALAGSLEPSGPFGPSSTSLAADGTSGLGGSSLGDASGNGGSSSVPEPSTLLLALGGCVCLWHALRRRART